MNILFIKHFFVGFIVSEIPRVSIFGYFPVSIYVGLYNLWSIGQFHIWVKIGL